VFVQTSLDAHGRAAGHFHATGARPRCLDRLRTHGATLGDHLFERRDLGRQENPA